MSFLLTIISTALLLATAAGSLPLRGAFYDTLSHFMLQYALAAGVLLVVSLFSPSLLSTGAATLSLALALFQLYPYARPITFPAHADGTVRILQSNMLFTNRRIGGLMHAIEDLNPDVIVICEANGGHAAYLRDIARLYPHLVATPQKNGPFGMAIASRLPMTNIQAHHFTHERILSYSFDVRLDGKLVTVLAIHPSNPLKNIGLRDRELVTIARWIKTQEHPVIVTGDFNITPYAQAYKEFIAATGLRNARIGQGLRHGTYHSALPSFMRLPIDHTLYSSQLVPVDYTTIKIAHSDHMATLASFGFSTAGR